MKRKVERTPSVLAWARIEVRALGFNICKISFKVTRNGVLIKIIILVLSI